MKETLIPIRFIGRRDSWREVRYGSGLTFTRNQVRSVPEKLANRLLRHIDLFELAEQVETEEAAKAAAKDDTEDQLAAAKEQAAKRKAEEAQRQSVVDRVMVMDKQALEDFAKANYQQDLDKRRSVETLRQQVVSFIDRFGVV